MTKPKAGGNVTRRIALDFQDVHLRFARLLKVIADDLTDGDNDTRTAQRAVTALNLDNFEAFAAHGKIADGALSEAETAVMRLAQSEKRD